MNIEFIIKYLRKRGFYLNRISFYFYEIVDSLRNDIVVSSFRIMGEYIISESGSYYLSFKKFYYENIIVPIYQC